MVKGDNDGSGATDGGDIGLMKASIQNGAPADQQDLYLNDFDSSGAVDGGDIGGMTNAIHNVCS